MSLARRALLILTVVLAACSGSEDELPPIRDAIGFLYVAEESVDVRKAPEEGAAVVATYKAGEPVSILSTRGPWAEVRVGDGSGWIPKSALSASQEAADARGSDTVRFKNPPSPIYSQGRVKGEIVLEGTVNLEGRVTSIRTLRNTTGSKLLEGQNIHEFSKSTFYPLLVNGKPRTFIYEYRISY
jgi:uncharacterized protein YgiM (DUF1202 family)